MDRQQLPAKGAVGLNELEARTAGAPPNHALRVQALSSLRGCSGVYCRFSRKEACSQPPKRGILSLTGFFADDEVIESKPMPSKAPSQRYRGVLAWRFQSSYRRRDWRGFDELLPSSVPPEDDYLFPG
ncbi:hypothetical protein KXV68_008020 [Aspergillus fumigatus]|nr:hypothetical protein CNMCM8714_003921 [Aspergillus fumigatus]KAF4270725.1 hypothetical protein CNMCM8812_000951 [Aspergillus fumigatus]KAH1524328.1 hypothetical protein KXX29_003276 [Aspergillus fumigatus]KAH1576951.1 hypothetical protein KXX17_007969 [Aspergillus fumigatus]KAH1608973.1 hypothetical protein KXX44_006189 [Aspergillus fumigatus]